MTGLRAFIAKLPGCAADAKILRDALPYVDVVIHERLDTARELGRPIPQPKGGMVFA
jgi:predicted RNase H-like HicB family nuclease